MILGATATLCLALNIYYEARSEPYQGQIAVSQVVLNRVADSRWPDDPCSVITQKKQFSWYWQGRTFFKLKDVKSWNKAVSISIRVLNGDYIDITRGSVFYHVVRKDHYHKEKIIIGNHVFLKEL
jgi:N-acetylmuramoyl-L-alanine amidase